MQFSPDYAMMNSAAYDAASLAALKRQSAKGDGQSLRQVAQQMEGLFVQMMLKSMRAALPQDGILSSDQTRLYTSLYDQQIAQAMSGKGLGIADMLVKQLSGAGTRLPESVGTVPMALDGEMMQSLPTQALEQVLRRAVPRPQRLSIPPQPGNGDFIARLSVPAQIAGRQSGIPHQLIMAQAALESGWGEREIPAAGGMRSHNLFGIKAGSRWNGPTTEITTTEYSNGVAYKTKAKFRVYDSYLSAIRDYVQLLTRNPRYAQVSNAGSPEQAAHALQKAGYATDPNYAEKLVRIMNQIRGVGEQVVSAYTTDLKDLF
ncbi:flagellar assembly peptidoglycan hydrolase FlgJ [Enterobacillus tribolii]